MEIIVLFSIGLASAITGAILGLGGGVFIVPALLFYDQFSAHLISPQIAVGTSLIIVVVTSFSSAMSFIKQKRVDIKAGLTFFMASGPGAIIGSFMNQQLSLKWFQLLFGLMLLFFALLLFVRKEPIKKPILPWTVHRQVEYEGKTVEYGYHIGIALVISFIVGVLSGLFGIGGGILMVLVLVMVFRFPPHMATATSMFMIFFSSILGSSTHMMLGNINWLIFFMIAPGAYLGGKIGAFIAKKMKSSQLMLFFRLTLALLGIQMIYEAIFL